MRGRILRDTSQGDGIVFVDGEQKTFSLERHWRSPVPPRTGATVAVEFDDSGQITSLIQLDEAQLLKEQGQKALGALATQGQAGARQLFRLANPYVLGALAILLVAWLFLATLNIRVTASMSQSATFYDLLRMINAPAGVGINQLALISDLGAGFYGLLMWLCLLAPLAMYFHPQRHLPLAACLPAIYMSLVQLSAYTGFKRQISQAAELGSAFGGKMARDMITQMIESATKAISLGFGFYVAWAAALFLAYYVIRQFLQARITVQEHA